MLFVESVKLPMKRVIMAMQIGFSDQDFYDELLIKTKIR